MESTGGRRADDGINDAAGLLPPIAVLIMTGSSLLVTGTAFRPKHTERIPTDRRQDPLP